MGQFNDRVERVRKLLKAEAWSKNVKCIHAHSLGSMWYDDTNNTESVVDVEYWSGLITRTASDSGKVTYFGTPLKGDALIDRWEQFGADNG